jgi:hypothetical protein
VRLQTKELETSSQYYRRSGELVKDRVGVEKVQFLPKQPKFAGYKMSRKLKKSLVGHPSAILFLQISRKGVFSTATRTHQGIDEQGGGRICARPDSSTIAYWLRTPPRTRINEEVTIVVLAFLLLAAVAQAQELPVADASVGYSFLFVAKGHTLTLNGGSSAVTFNLNRWLGIVSDFGTHDGSAGMPGLIGETYAFGPRFSYRKWNRLVPFAQGVIGGAHANTTNGSFLGANNAFAYAGGGGFTCFRQN